MNQIDKIKQTIEKVLEWLLDQIPKARVPVPVPAKRPRPQMPRKR